MKKFVTFLLVLAMTCVGSATIVDIQPIPEGEPGSITNPLSPSDELSIPVYSDFALISLNAGLLVSGPGTIIGAINTADCAGYGWHVVDSYDPVGIPGQDVEIGVGVGAANNTSPLGSVAYFLIHCDDYGEMVLTLEPRTGFGGSLDDNYQVPTITGQITVYQIPEPMTVALLGLGSLALLRKRR